ncbi:MAG: hypothetical protein HOP29_14190 [Phycisphaerales bacterium]|nr:hypothetical protein [Phycisphaerales bacterium]
MTTWSWRRIISAFACSALMSCAPIPNAGFGDDANTGDSASDGTVGLPNREAWVAGRIVFADIDGGRIVTTTNDGRDTSTLVEADRPACPAVSGDGQAIAFSLRDREPGEIAVMFRDGRVHRFEGLTGHDPLRVTLNADGSRIAFQEVTPPAPVNACGPIHLALGNFDGTGLEAIVSGDTLCAEWPEWSADGAFVAYAHVDLAAENPGRLCLLDPATGAQARCFDNPAIGIAHRTWSPDSAILLGHQFRAMRVADGREVSDPWADVTGQNPELADGELLAAIDEAVERIGWTLVPGGMAGDVLPISVNWGNNDKLVFDALARQGAGTEAVHIFTYDFPSGQATHVAGPFAEANTNNHNFSLLCPRWVP